MDMDVDMKATLAVFLCWKSTPYNVIQHVSLNNFGGIFINLVENGDRRQEEYIC